MRAVIFGAGASFGSGEVFPKPPPLGSGLFPALRRLYPTWRSVPNEVSGLFEKHFELGMAEIISNYGFSVGPLMQEMARFFSIFGMNSDSRNYYRNFVQSIGSRDDLLIGTLNYECLLEIAISLEGHSVGYFADPGSVHNQIPVWKLHGSCNFRVEGIEATRGVSYSGTGVVFGGDITPIDPSEVRKYYSGNTSLYPAMALYASGKPVNMSPGPITEAQMQWNGHIDQCDRILVIGANPFPADKHIWDSIARSKAEIAAVGGRSEFKQWAQDYGKVDTLRFLGSRWEECFNEANAFITG